jgi:phosphoenolpyruvate phosphomutase
MTVPDSKARRFRELLLSPDLEFLMEAHNGLSARIVEEAGFKGIWASGLTISAQMGLRDSNEASWTQVLDCVEFIGDATSIPLMLDGDTGYGNFNNFRRLIAKLEQRGTAAVCIEDKLFPKTNSFLGEAQPLADVDEFCGKIKAGKDSQRDDDFSIVARVEALISGRGMAEALSRAEAYRAAGADAILIHSKSSRPDEVLAFAREWANRAPLVIVPTAYYATPTEAFRKAGISMAIWANHTLRAAITAMQRVTRRIHDSESLIEVEGEVAGVKEIFRLTGNAELEAAEARYLARREALPVIVLAASRGEGLDALTAGRPKSMIDLQGRPLLRRLADNLHGAGFGPITVVRGYKAEAIDLPDVRTADNPAWETTGEAASLAVALPGVRGACVVGFGDILVRRYILDQLAEAAGDAVLVVDGRPEMRDGRTDAVRCARPMSAPWLEESPVAVEALGDAVATGEASGRWIGLAKFSSAGRDALAAEIEAMRGEGVLGRAQLLDAVERMRAHGTAVSAIFVDGHWLDVNSMPDVVSANRFLSCGGSS